MTGYQTVEEVLTAFSQALEVENNAVWIQGDVLNHAVEAGFSLPDVATRCAGLSLARVKRSTIYARYKTSRVFPPEKRLEAVPWSLHMLAAQTDDPDYWVRRACDEHLSFADLKLLTRTPGPEHHIVLSGEMVTVYAVTRDPHGHGLVTFQFAEKPPVLTDGQQMLLTLASVQVLGQEIP